MQIYFVFKSLKFHKTIIYCSFIKINYCLKAFIMTRRYTKADLEQIVFTQLENLNAMHDLLSIMKLQNELLERANKKLKDEISDFKVKMYPVGSKRK